mmetsp:Transcript_44477/g.79801  ORF Transcript_44477/g.79801 Transcript_44477/m.79801 type:complete len:106 (-) Transcript_44477:97-414(-)
MPPPPPVENTAHRHLEVVELSASTLLMMISTTIVGEGLTRAIRCAHQHTYLRSTTLKSFLHPSYRRATVSSFRYSCAYYSATASSYYPQSKRGQCSEYSSHQQLR